MRNMAYAIASPDLRASYWARIRGYEQNELAVRVPMVFRRAKEMSKMWDRTSIAVRNVALGDALRLLHPEAIPMPAHWQFVDTDQLLAYAQSAHAQNTHADTDCTQALAILDKLVAKARQDTYPSFEYFAQAQAQAQASFDAAGNIKHAQEEKALERYELWIKRFRPYLVLDVPLSDKAQVDIADAELHRRVTFFLSKNPLPDLEVRYLDRLWTYIYKVRRHVMEMHAAS